MSILIKGMEMPTTYPLTVTIYPDGQVLSETVGAKNIHGEAVPVPEHGDLIEREALKNECRENAKRGIGLWVDYMDISLAPTIIPAEEGET